MMSPRPASRTLLGVAAALAVLAAPAFAGHKYRDVLVVPSAAPVVYAAPVPTVYAAPVVVQSAPTVVVERTRFVEAAPVVVSQAPVMVATPVPTAYVVPRRALRPMRRPRGVVAQPAVVVPTSRVVVLPGW
jgi:hypothetical protein